MMYLGNNPIGLVTSLPIFNDKIEIEYGEYTPTVDEDVISSYFSHSLGRAYDFIFYTSNGINMVNEDSIYLIGGLIYNNFTNYTYPINIITYYKGANSTLVSNTRGAIASMSGTHDANHNIESYCRLFGPTNCKLKANVTYRYILGYFKEVTPNV